MPPTALLTRRRPPACSARHKSCSRSHWELVEAYRAARENDEQARDVACGGMVGSEEWCTVTARMVTFKAWLISSAGAAAQQEQYGYELEAM